MCPCFTQLRRRALPARDGDDERGPLAALALDVDGAVVRDDDLARDVQAEPEPAVVERDGALEALEDAPLIGGVDADAVIADGQERGVVVAADRDLDGLAGAVL